MNWATYAIEALLKGEKARITPSGNSMTPRINNGDQVTLAPITEPIKEGDIVLVKVRGQIYLHLIKAIKTIGPNEVYLIANNRGRDNGWVSKDKIYGIVVKVKGK
jgi:phage repressor protein C with HTH and peptisase S24 domain